MSLVLPPPVAACFDANARLDARAMAEPFAVDAVVVDERRRHEGREAIGSWIETASIASKAIFTPSASRAMAGLIEVEGEVRGEFPGSPVSLTFLFQSRDEAIASVEIR